MHNISAEQGIVATAYDPRKIFFGYSKSRNLNIFYFSYTKEHGEHGRLLQLVKLYLYSMSSGLYGCPLAMTDGAASVLNHVI